MLLDLHFLRESQRFLQNVESGEQIQILVLFGLAKKAAAGLLCMTVGTLLLAVM